MEGGRGGGGGRSHSGPGLPATHRPTDSRRNLFEAVGVSYETMGSELSGSAVTITGGLGFIGSNLAIELVERGADVTVVDLPCSEGGPDAAVVAPVRESVEVVRADVRDREAIAPHVVDADVVYHLAARISRPGSVEHPDADVAVNCTGTLNVLESAAAASTPPRVVFTSSQSAVGEQPGATFDGSSQGRLVDVYGANKRAAEGYCETFRRSRGVPTVVVRLSNVYGPRGGLDATAVDTFLRAALRDEPLTVFEPGTQRRDFVYVSDVVAALVELGSADGVAGERFAVGTGTTHTLEELATAIVDAAAGGRVELVEWPEEWEALRLGDLRADPSRLAAATDWSPTVELEAGLERTVDYYERRPPEPGDDGPGDW